jgi:uncharacterized protein with HEPN domain
MPHSPPVLLEDIRHAAQQIQNFTAGRSLNDYKTDELLRAGVERLFILIGEALGRLEKIDAGSLNQITDFRRIIGFRNVLVHGYETIDDQIVWQMIQQHLPILKDQIEKLLVGFGPP